MSDLKYATLATVSRCGMVWFSEDVVTTEMLFENYLARLNSYPLTLENSQYNPIATTDEKPSRVLEIQQSCSQYLFMHMAADGLVPTALEYAMKNVDHIMEPTKQRLLLAFFSMMNFSVKQLLEYDSNHRDFPLTVKLYFLNSYTINLE